MPIPLPQALERARGPWEERPLADRRVVVGAAPGGTLSPVLAVALASAGAQPFVGRRRRPGAVQGRRRSVRPSAARRLEAAGDQPYWALLFDATGIADPSGLRALYDFFHPIVGRLARSGRIVVLGRALEDLLGSSGAVGGGAERSETIDPAAAAAQMALDGFVRSMSKEVGRTRRDGEPGAGRRRCAGARAAAVALSRLDPRGVRHGTADPRQPAGGAGCRAATAKCPGRARSRARWRWSPARRAASARPRCRLLAAEGAQVVCLDRPADDAPLSQIAREIGGTPILADVSDAEAPAKIATELEERLGGVDVVVHNAGITRDKTLAKMKPELWEQTIDVNLGAVARITAALTRTGGPLRDGGRIICLSSVAGIAGNLGQTNYAASKAGIIGLVRALAPKLAGRGITVNAIAPGFIETRLTAAIPVVIREVGRRLSALGQGGLPDDIGQLVTFLASPGAQGVTGQIIRDCGGALIGA